MANILNIDTASGICSVALAKDGEVILGYESSEKMDHSTSLAPFAEKCLNYARDHRISLDAVAVSAGPGSYTGLRIGMSLAKGICFGLNIPLITISTLKIMAVRAIFTDDSFEGDELIVPMVDARRMEVYTGVFNSGLELLEEEKPLILDENSFSNLIDERKVIFIGDGSSKFRELYSGKNAIWAGEGMSHAKYMATLAELDYRKKNFADLAYSVPSYLKEYQAGKPKNKVFNQ